MCECFSHRQIALKLQQGLGDLNFRDLTDGAGMVADQRVNRIERGVVCCNAPPV